VSFLQRLVTINGKKQLYKVAGLMLGVTLIHFAVRYWGNLALATVHSFMFYLCVLLFLGLHEFSHALTAFLMGDTSQKQRGRLTLNPLNHVDPLGLMAFVMIGVGWGKPVETGFWFRKYPRLQDFFITLSGPLSNLAAAGVFMAITGQIFKSGTLTPENSFEPFTMMGLALIFVRKAVLVNCLLFVLNILPIPPLDGGKALLTLFRPPQGPGAKEPFAMEGMIILALLFLFADLGGAISAGAMALHNLMLGMIV